MALQVWLPLNNDFNNKGLDNTVTVTTSNVSIESGGKNGGCTQVTASKRIVIGAKPYMSPKGDNEFSIAMWVNATTFNYIIAFSSFELRLLSNLAQFRTGSGPAPYTINAQKNGTYNTNTWYHICGTWSSKAGRVRVYVNGELGAETNERPGDYQAGSSTMNLVYGGDWKISDFRIYDNELSEIDVKELYWSKVLEFTPQWKHSGELSVFGDASGLNYPLTPYNVTLSNNIAQFNGTSSYIGFDSPNIVGGSVSIWFSTPTKPNSGYKFLYYDPVSKMLVTFSSDGTLHVAGDGSTQPRYQTTGITWGQLTNVVATWDSNRKPTALYVNGVKPVTGSTTTWSTAGTACAIGRRLGTANGDYFSGSINEVKVFASQLTAADAQYIYHIGPNQNKWTPDEPVWLRILHHNAPATNLFTQANSRDNDDENLFSKLKVLFNNDNFRRADGNYEFMAKEKLNSTSTEQTYRWTQTSNPTASTCTGYKLVSQTNNPGRNFGISFGPTGNCVFSNKNAWWCALGCWTAYQGGIPGFENVVKTGYMDLYVRADKGGVPSEYVELEYIESTGASYFNTGEKFNCESDECKVIFKGNDLNNNGMIFASNGAKYFWLYYYSTSGVRVYADNGNGQQGIAGIARDTEKHTMEWRGKHYYIDGSDKGTLSNTYTETTNNIWLFSYGGSGYPFKGRIYYADIKRGGIYTRIFKPVKRRSDSVAGMYDVVTNTFYPSSATAFTAGPEI